MSRSCQIYLIERTGERLRLADGDYRSWIAYPPYLDHVLVTERSTQQIINLFLQKHCYGRWYELPTDIPNEPRLPFYVTFRFDCRSGEWLIPGVVSVPFPDGNQIDHICTYHPNISLAVIASSEVGRSEC